MRILPASARRLAIGLVTLAASGSVAGIVAPPTADAAPSTPGGLGSLYNTAQMINADDFWAAGYDGTGIDVAVIDTGVAKVAGLKNNVVNGPDISFDANGDSLDGIDAFGHGTHMAGIIARRPYTTKPTDLIAYAKDNAVGVAPGARIVNVRVGAADGAVDVSQLIAGIDWVVQNRNTDGRNIRVLNLSVGTTGVQDYKLDPLTFAVENAWNKGIVVVVSAGNDGIGSEELDNPAYDPRIIAVGASDHNDTLDTSDDTVADFSSRGTYVRRPDFVAPGVSIESARVPGSFIDSNFPDSALSGKLTRGSGSSQAAAVTSGAVALILDRYPTLTPNQVKALLKNTGRSLKAADGTYMDAFMKLFDLAKVTQYADSAADPKMSWFVDQAWLKPATGLGSLDAARGDDRLTDGITALSGEVDVLGRKWVAADWTAAAMNATSWDGRKWQGATFSNSSWNGRLWNGSKWSGRRWNGTFSNSAWIDSPWIADAYNGRLWKSSIWNGSRWSGRLWKSVS